MSQDRAEDYRLEPLTEADRRAVIDIFNYFIETSFAAFREVKLSYDGFDRFLSMIGDYPAVTVRTASNEPVGFAFMHPFHPAETFSRSAEVTYFILPDHTDKGLGGVVLEHLVEAARGRGITVLLASISSFNEQSLAFHRKHGFVECGRFKEIGAKHGRVFDMVWMQKKI